MEAQGDAAMKLARLTVYPIKSLDGVALPAAGIVEHGALQHDRAYAMFTADGKWLRAKRSDKLHRLRTCFAGDFRSMRVRIEGEDVEHNFSLEGDRRELSAWLSEFLGEPIEVRHRPGGGYPDEMDIAQGPTVISTATLQTVQGWFPHLPLDEIRRRFRANLEIESVKPFWEDHLWAGDAPAGLTIGDVTLHRVQPVPRCTIPTRDTQTGVVADATFQKTFLARREAELPPALNRERYKHWYYLAVVSHIADQHWGKTITVGDPVTVTT